MTTMTALVERDRRRRALLSGAEPRDTQPAAPGERQGEQEEPAEPPNPGDPGPEMPEPRTPQDPAEDPRLPPQEFPRGV